MPLNKHMPARRWQASGPPSQDICVFKDPTATLRHMPPSVMAHSYNTSNQKTEGEDCFKL